MLKVSSGVGQLCTVAMTTTTAAAVAQQLAAEGRSFYCEPRPDDQSRISVDAEHAGRVRELAASLPGAPEPLGWHLFYIEVDDPDGTHAFIVSADSDSETKARELAEAAALDHCGADFAEDVSVSHCHKLCMTDVDVFESIGTLAEN
jgi:hypothetical protein